MLFPDTQRVEYTNNPLDEVICQIRFPSILKIGATPPSEFQDRIRTLFPLYEEQDDGGIPVPQQVKDILSGAGLEGMFPTQTSRLHRFLSEDELRSVSLQTNFLAFTVKDYRRWQDFRERLEFVESQFRCIYEPSFYSRIGLRYKDVITRKHLGLEECSWGELLNSALSGLLSNSEASDNVAQALTAIQMRLPEIEGAQLMLKYGLPAQSGQVPLDTYVIDTDIFTEQKVQPHDSFRLLDRFNKATGNIFRWAISDTLRDALEPQPI